MGNELSWLKNILENKLSLDEFSRCLTEISKILEKENISFIDLLRKNNAPIDNEYLSNEFFRRCLILSGVRNNMPSLPEEYKYSANKAMDIFNSNILGPICFITPEIGEYGSWTTVGGLGIMVYELCQALASLGQNIIVISPYYKENKDGQTDYLSNDTEYIRNTSINLDEKYEFGVHYGNRNDIRFYFLRNEYIFPKAYNNTDPVMTTKEIACFGKASLQLLCDLQIIPSIILTNDWFSGLTPAYAKNGSFGDIFKGTKFIHICHNLEPEYEGRIYPTNEQGNLEGIYQFNPDWVIDNSWDRLIINPSRCAIKMSDQWATVSHSYKNDLKNNSPLKNLLNEKWDPFSYPNGIIKEKRMKLINEFYPREDCKRYIQQKYFGYKDLDNNVPVFSFIGRITKQKGVKLILDAVEEMINITNGKINILVGGMGYKNDPYSEDCSNQINYLRQKYPNSFWASPNEYFKDGININKGSDFGLMPSLYEPGGIVQHEFFVAGTPVIAYRTGGLKDTVYEFNYQDNNGNGITFDSHNHHDLIEAMKRALNLFYNKEKYGICQRNAFNSVIDVKDVSKAWCKEFFKLSNKIFFNAKEVGNTPVNNIAINYLNDDMANVSFRYKIYFRMPKEVYICGEFDNWNEKHSLHYYENINMWSCDIKMKKGKYQYKYIVDGNWEINYNDLNVGNDILNNVIYV